MKKRSMGIVDIRLNRRLLEELERKAFEQDTTISWIANECVKEYFGMSSKDFKHAKLPKTLTARKRNKELYGKATGEKENQDDFEGFVFLA